MNQDPKAQKTFTTITGNDLMAQEYAPLQFSIGKILPHGIFVFAGSPKAGKSWLTLEMCQAVSTGGKQWDFTTTQGDALYLALEDNYNRLQGRLKQMRSDGMDMSRLHLTTSSLGIQNGLLEQVHNFIAANPGTNFIAIDTLERIRSGSQDSNIYSCDYKDMTRLREITDKHKLTLFLIHHTRKMYDPDPLNTVSGSTGLMGAVDGVFVLIKNKRTGSGAKLNIINRDTATFCFDLRFEEETCRWSFIGDSVEDAEDEDPLCVLLNDFLKDEWKGTATELYNELKQSEPGFDLTPAMLKKRLKSLTGLFKKDYGIVIDFDRTHKSKLIFLSRSFH